MNGLTITSTSFPDSAPTAWDIQAVGDLNGDGKSDVIWRNNSNRAVAVWLMNGATITFTTFPGAPSTDWKIQ